MSIERRRNHSVSAQLRTTVRLVTVLGPLALVVAIARLQGSTSPSDRLADAYTPDTWFDGAIADVNLVAWGISATIAYFGGWIAFQTGRPSAGRFLTVGGAVSSWLLVDHMLLIHADVLPDAGVPRMAAGIAALLPVLGWIVYFKGEVRRTRWMLLASATMIYQVAIMFGTYWSIAEQSTVVSEEATLLAASSWTLYMALTTRDIARSTIRAAKAQPAPVDEPTADRVSAPA